MYHEKHRGSHPGLRRENHGRHPGQDRDDRNTNLGWIIRAMSPKRRLGEQQPGGGTVNPRRLGRTVPEGGDPVTDRDCTKGLRL